MRLIGLAVVLTFSLAFAPLAAEAQQAARVPQVGSLSTSSGSDPRAQREYALVGFSKLFGYYPVAWEPGKFELHWNATEAFTTGQLPVIHGGAVASLLDNVMGWATMSLLDDSENFATADLQIQFVRGAQPGLLKAQGSVVRRTRALAFCQSEARNSEGQLVARGSATCSIFKAT